MPATRRDERADAPADPPCLATHLDLEQASIRHDDLMVVVPVLFDLAGVMPDVDARAVHFLFPVLRRVGASAAARGGRSCRCCQSACTGPWEPCRRRAEASLLRRPGKCAPAMPSRRPSLSPHSSGAVHWCAYASRIRTCQSNGPAPKHCADTGFHVFLRAGDPRPGAARGLGFFIRGPALPALERNRGYRLFGNPFRHCSRSRSAWRTAVSAQCDFRADGSLAALCLADLDARRAGDHGVARGFCNRGPASFARSRPRARRFSISKSLSMKKTSSHA